MATSSVAPAGGDAIVAGRPRALRIPVLLGAGSGRVRLQTVTVMRWVAVAGQAFTLMFVHFWMGMALPLAGLLPAVGLTALVNLALVVAYGARARLSDRAAARLFAYDVLQLCWLLGLTGGLQNPFCILILLPVTLAAATLGVSSTLAVTGLALAGTSVLGLVPAPLPWHQLGPPPSALLLLAGWTALSMTIILVAVFAWSIAEEARRYADALATTQLALAREQKLSALGAQAAAAAHTLGSPLGTINVIAKELVRELPSDSPMLVEAQELLDQAKRCGRILAGFASQREAIVHEPVPPAPFSTLLASLAEEVARPGIRVIVRVDLPGRNEPELVLAPAIRHAVANLIDNAIQFARSRVEMALSQAPDGLRLQITDDGPGFPSEVLDRLGEPYVSTRTGQGGMGLGVFIAATLLARTGARLTFDNVERGARVTIEWPAPAVARLSEEQDDDR